MQIRKRIEGKGNLKKGRIIGAQWHSQLGMHCNPSNSDPTGIWDVVSAALRYHYDKSGE